ncbi:glycosyltransferase, partial [Roseateles flavus]
VQREHRNAHVVIVGGDDVSYGARPKDAKNWREKMLAEVGSQLDPTRTHFMGKLPYADYKRVLQVSSAHVYLTYPFVLSWSCLEAMATGCYVVGSDTAPVREVLDPGAEGPRGMLVDGLKPEAVRGGLAQMPIFSQGSGDQQLRSVAAARKYGKTFSKISMC